MLYKDEDALMEHDNYINEMVSKKKEVPLSNGHCLNCGEPSATSFCSKECHTDYHIREKQSRG